MLNEKLFEKTEIRIGYIICIVTAIGFVCSLTYNQGYFWYFDAGVRILSIGDILTSYSLWIPGFGTLVFGYCLDLFLQHLEKAETAKLKRHRKIIKKILGLPHLALILILLCVIIAHSAYHYTFRPLVLWFAYGYLWMSVTSLLFAFKPFKKRVNRFIFSFFIYLPIMLSLMFTLGIDKCILDSHLHHANANIFFMNAKETATPAILIRHLERGLLAKEVDSRNLKLFLWEDISNIEILSDKS